MLEGYRIMTKQETDRLKALARTIRRKIITMSAATGTGHVGSSLSVVDVLIVLYEHFIKGLPEDPERDRVIFSKGHASAALYAVLAHRGILPQERLETFATNGTRLGHHPHYEPAIGLEANTGSLGHGLPIGCGLAYSAKLAASNSRTFVIMSDGETNEGSVWEAAAFAGHHRLASLCMILDANQMQAMGNTRDILDPIDHSTKWRAFGWEALDVDGHNMAALAEAIGQTGSFEKPLAIIAHTIKGKGVSFMEKNLLWHYRPPKGEEYRAALKELDSCE
jgi:transketolase